MSEASNHLHVKRHKAGSPNELSLDVLDAARTELDDKKNLSGKVGKAASIGSFGDIARTPSHVAPKPEKGASTPTRKRRRRLLISGGLVVVLAIVAVAVSFGLNFTESKVTFHDEFREAMHKLAPVDEVLVTVDDIMTSSPENVDSKTRTTALASFGEARNSLKDAKEAAQGLEEDIVTSQEDATFDRFEKTVELRESMLNDAEQAINYAEETDKQCAEFEAVWSDVFEADQLARAASDQANMAETMEKTEAARDATQLALNRCAVALASLSELAEKYKSVDVSRHIEYLRKRTEALEHAVATGDALIEGDREKAKAENDEYNRLDEEAVAIASELPLSMGETVRAGFDEKMESYCSSYLATKEQADELDEAIAKYLGN